MRHFVLSLGVLAASAGWAVSADGYSPWTPNPAKNRHECVYTYATKTGKPATQTVYAYTAADKDRAGWGYFYNAKAEPWARCALPGNPVYDPKQMHWQQLNPRKDGYADYPMAGYCPTPADGAKPIPDLPPPPK